MAPTFEPLRVLGMMSGTSLDGVDAAVLETDGDGVINVGASGFEPYSNDERECLRAALGQWQSDDNRAAHEVVLDAHTRLARRFDVDLIGFHGQTLAHDPDHGRTHQLGDGAALALKTGRKVVWDFRTQDMEDGGQGAPLAPFYHHALARQKGITEPVAFLNLGGVANVSWVDPGVANPAQSGALLAFDTGPANALLDDFLMKTLGLAYDKGGALARDGKVIASVLQGLGEMPYLLAPPPKSLDRDAFAHLSLGLEGATPRDVAATLTAVTAACVEHGLQHMPSRPERWFACGGGRKNSAMMGAISDAIGVTIAPVEEIGCDGDMLEAEAFAWLAARVLRGLPTSAPATTGCRSPQSGGRLSRP